jgi:hypothetical protein
MAAHALVQARVRAFAKKIDVLLAQRCIHTVLLAQAHAHHKRARRAENATELRGASVSKSG